MTKPIYLFIDESGDPGYVLENQASSPHYAELALQFTEVGLSNLLAHLISWKYVLGKFSELKSLPVGPSLERYIKPIEEMCNQGELCCSCVYLMKADYSGPYLKPSSRCEQNPIRFRNFVHRQLLEYHFSIYPPQPDYEIELVFDRYKMKREDIRNLEDYLINNWKLPNLEHICHTNSQYTEALQLSSQLVSAVKDIALGKADELSKTLLRFVALKNITRI